MSPRSSRRDELAELLERLGEHPAAAALVEPGELLAPQQEDAAQDQLAHALGVRLRVGQRQGRAPRAAEQLPALDAEVRAQPLHVGDQVPGGVGLQAGVRQRAAAAALVEQHDAVARRVVIAAHGGVAAAAGPAVHDQRRLAVGVAALLEVDLVPAADLEPLLAIGLDRRIETEPLTCRHRWRCVLSLLSVSARPAAAMVTCERPSKASYRAAISAYQAGVRFLSRSRRISRS